MKILKAPGYKDWKQVCTCSRCKAELEIVVEDISGNYQSGGARAGGSSGGWNYTVICAVCKYILPVTTKSLTPYIEHVIQNKKKDNGPYNLSGCFER